jgi:hypothetical protein
VGQPIKNKPTIFLIRVTEEERGESAVKIADEVINSNLFNNENLWTVFTWRKPGVPDPDAVFHGDFVYSGTGSIDEKLNAAAIGALKDYLEGLEDLGVTQSDSPVEESTKENTQSHKPIDIEVAYDGSDKDFEFLNLLDQLHKLTGDNYKIIRQFTGEPTILFFEITHDKRGDKIGYALNDLPGVFDKENHWTVFTWRKPGTPAPLTTSHGDFVYSGGGSVATQENKEAIESLRKFIKGIEHETITKPETKEEKEPVKPVKEQKKKTKNVKQPTPEPTLTFEPVQDIVANTTETNHVEADNAAVSPITFVPNPSQFKNGIPLYFSLNQS